MRHQDSQSRCTHLGYVIRQTAIHDKCLTRFSVPLRLERQILVGLTNLTNDPAYLDQLAFDDANSNVKLFDAYSKLDEMQDDDGAITKLSEWTDQSKPVLDRLTKAGFTPLKSIRAKFEQAGMYLI